MNTHTTATLHAVFGSFDSLQAYALVFPSVLRRMGSNSPELLWETNPGIIVVDSPTTEGLSEAGLLVAARIRGVRQWYTAAVPKQAERMAA
jgi:hypothetical protein